MKSNEAIATVAQALVTEWLSNGWSSRSSVSDIRVDDLSIVPKVSASKQLQLAESFWDIRGNMVQDIYNLGLSDAIAEAASKMIAIRAETLARKMADSIENTLSNLQWDLRSCSLTNVFCDNPYGSEDPSLVNDIEDGMIFEYSSNRVVEFVTFTAGFSTSLNLTLYAVFVPQYVVDSIDFTPTQAITMDLVH